MMSQLSPRELRELFVDKILPDYINAQHPHPVPDMPVFISVGGQPGSGKGRVLEQSYQNNPGSVIVNGDDLRRFHPAYETLMATDPLRMPEVTGKASGPWVGMCAQYLREHHISAIVETTLRDANMLAEEFTAYKQAGYTRQLSVVAVPLAVSRLGTLSRYVGQVELFGAGRWTPSHALSKNRAVLPAR